MVSDADSQHSKKNGEPRTATIWFEAGPRLAGGEGNKEHPADWWAEKDAASEPYQLAE